MLQNGPFRVSEIIPCPFFWLIQCIGLRDLADQFDAKPAEIRALFDNQLDPTRATDLRDRMLAAGLPI